jgi:hypothetical protein
MRKYARNSEAKSNGLRLWSHQAIRRNYFRLDAVKRPKEIFMRFVFIALVGSVLSIAAFKYFDRGIGGDEILASPTELSAMN